MSQFFLSFPYWHELLTVSVVHILGAMSPGPDFVLISKNSISYSRRTGIWSSLGVSLGIGVHVLYCLVGIGVLITQSIVLFSIVKYIGAAYLVYIGVKALRSKRTQTDTVTAETHHDLTAAQAIRTGFLTNVLNPKATLFILSVFTQVIQPSTPQRIQAMYGVEMIVATFAWFSIVALLLSTPIIVRRFRRIQHWFERTMGAILIALGIKVALSSQK